MTARPGGTLHRLRADPRGFGGLGRLQPAIQFVSQRLLALTQLTACSRAMPVPPGRLNALVEQIRDRAAHLRLAETLSAFLTRLRSAAETLDVLEWQRIVRLLVKDVLVSDDTIVIRHCIHCIPVPSGPSPTASGPNGHAGALTDRPSYLLRSGSSSA